MRRNEAGCAEQQVGRAVYERIQVLIGAKPGTPEAAELEYLIHAVQEIEEYGQTDWSAAVEMRQKWDPNRIASQTPAAIPEENDE